MGTTDGKKRGRSKRVFLITPIGKRGTEIRKRSDEILKLLIAPVVNRLGYEAVRADQISKTGQITSQIMEHIFKDTLTIVDLTGFNPNVCYELGIRHTLQRGAILLVDSTQENPFDLKDSRTIRLHKDWSGLDEAKKELRRQIKDIEDRQTVTESPTTPHMNEFLCHAITDGKLLSLLEDSKLRYLIEKAVGTIKGRDVAKDVYAVFNKYLLEELVGVTTKDRVYDMELTYDDTFGSLMRLDIAVAYTAVNDSKVKKPLFHDGVIEAGSTYPPATIYSLPRLPAATKIFSFTPHCFKVAGKEVDPKISVDWVDSENDHKKLVRHSAKLARTFRDGEVPVSYKCSMLQSQSDYVTRGHRSICNDITVNITKPRELDVFVLWSKTASLPYTEVCKASTGQTYYRQKLKGITIPGNGFAVWWRPRPT